MSNYNVGDMIKLTRQAIGMSQEELCDNICSVQTLSRIENGKVKVKKRTYQQLMEKMGRNGSKNYSVLSTENFDVLDIMVEVDNAIFRGEYEEAERKNIQLKKELDLTNKMNYLYIRKNEINIDDGLGRISKENVLEKLEELLAITIPNYKQLLNKTYPFMYEEILLFMNIGTAYGDLRESEKAIEIFYMLLRSLNAGYMGYEDSVKIAILLINNIARLYGGLGKCDVAIRMSWNAIKKAKENCLYSVLPKAYAEIAWNMMKQVKRGERSEADKELCKRYMRQGYAIAMLSKQKAIANTIKCVYRDFFGENIYGFFESSNGELLGPSDNN